MSPQAYTIAGVYLVLTLVMAIALIKIGQKLVAAFLFIGHVLFTALLAYDTNCLSSGNCGVWSWIRTAFYIICPLLLTFMLLMALSTGKINQSEEQQST
jgi:hypothetical protein